MKLYEVERNSKIVLKDDEGNEIKLNFHRLDGMYSYCTDQDGNPIHIAAWAEVEVEK